MFPLLSNLGSTCMDASHWTEESRATAFRRIQSSLQRSTNCRGWEGKGSPSIRIQRPENLFCGTCSPGRYVLQLAAFRAPDIYVADARIGQDSVFDSGFTIGGKSRESLEVVMKSQGGIVSGKVLDSSRLRPALYSTVVLVPESSRRQNFALYRQTISANGSFTFTGVPPGDYKLFAWGSAIPGAWENKLFLQRFETRGVAISVATGSEKNAQLTVIP